MTPWKLLPFSRRVAFIYIIAIFLLFLVHFKIANDFTYKRIKHYSDVRCRFGCFRDVEFYKLFSLNTHPSLLSKININNTDSRTSKESNFETGITSRTGIESIFKTGDTSNIGTESNFETGDTSRSGIESIFKTGYTSKIGTESIFETRDTSRTDTESNFETGDTLKTGTGSIFETRDTSRTDAESNFETGGRLITGTESVYKTRVTSRTGTVSNFETRDSSQTGTESKFETGGNGSGSLDESKLLASEYVTVNAELYKPPYNETPIRRFPRCVIIGFTKSGTRALIAFMSLHPYIRVARNEVHFYDRDENFELGYDWYKEQMPLSYSDQITVEKTPAYVLTQRARDEMYKITPNVKLIALVRDPVVRLVSQYLLRFRTEATTNQEVFKPVSAIYTNFTTGQFDPNLRPVDIGNYQKHINMWLEKFSFNQLLILNSEDLTRNPLGVLKRIEKFLKLPSLFSDFNVYYNRTSGFYCPRGFLSTSIPQCLGKSKGLAHPKLSSEEKYMLYEYYKPYNEKLFSLLGYRMKWTEREWGKEKDE